jgi:hypothetical protein
MQENSISDIIFNFISDVTNNKLVFTIFMLLGIGFGGYMYMNQSPVYSSSALCHSKIFPFETITNSTEPIIVNYKNKNYKNVASLLNLPDSVVTSITKIDFVQYQEMNNKVSFNGTIFKISLKGKSANNEVHQLFLDSLISYINNNRYIKYQLNLLKSAKNEQLKGIDYAIQELIEVETSIKEKIKTTDNINFEVGQLYESYNTLLDSRQNLTIENKRMENGIDLLSYSSAHHLKGFSLQLILMSGILLSYLLFNLYIFIRKVFKHL